MYMKTNMHMKSSTNVVRKREAEINKNRLKKKDNKNTKIRMEFMM